jgi:hypothetical protein
LRCLSFADARSPRGVLPAVDKSGTSREREKNREGRTVEADSELTALRERITHDGAQVSSQHEFIDRESRSPKYAV